jgi:hypothetical protein
MKESAVDDNECSSCVIATLRRRTLLGNAGNGLRAKEKSNFSAGRQRTFMKNFGPS